MITTDIIEFGIKLQRVIAKMARKVRNRFIMTDYEAWDLGAWAHSWHLRWRFFLVRHDHDDSQVPGPGTGPWRLYILCGNIESQFSEFIEMSYK